MGNLTGEKWHHFPAVLFRCLHLVTVYFRAVVVEGQAEGFVDVVLGYGARSYFVYFGVLGIGVNAVGKKDEEDACSRIGPNAGACETLVTKGETAATITGGAAIVGIRCGLVEAEAAVTDAAVVGREFVD